MTQKRALITGITGQDGSFLAELLLSKGYTVYGLVRRTSSSHLNCAEHLRNSVTFIDGDMCDQQSLFNAIKISKPNEVYNLAAQSHVGMSFKQPNATFDINGRGALYLLEAIRESGINCKFYQASTSELFGGVPGTEPQNESTPFTPKSPYAISKLFAFEMVRYYREAYNMFACNGILFNHESERRGINFVTRKITDGLARILAGLDDQINLGILDVQRDWGYAKDYVYGMWLMLQQEIPDDFILSTNETHSVRQFCEVAFNYVGLNYEDYVIVNPTFLRENEVNILKGDFSKANNILKWAPTTSFNELVKLMVDFDIRKYNITRFVKPKLKPVPEIKTESEPEPVDTPDLTVLSSNTEIVYQDDLLQLLKPKNIFSKKIRIGQEKDGGYIVTENLLNGCSCLFTYGCGGDTGFEEGYSKLTNKVSYIFDHTIGWPALERNGYIFTPEGLGFDTNCKDFFEHYNERNITDKVLLKIDIEGYEYEYFTRIDTAKLAPIVGGIILEVHWIDDESNRKKLIDILNKLSINFSLVHLHGNNWGGEWNYNESITLPRVLEFTFVNKNLITQEEVDSQTYPISGIDYPNNPNLAECDLSFLTKI